MRRDDGETGEVGRVQVDQTVVFFLVRVPVVPAKSQADGQFGRHFPSIVDVKTEFLLLEVEKSAVVLIAQIGRQTQKKAGETGAGVGRGCLGARIVYSGPIAIETVGAFRLLQFLDVVVLLTSFETEFDGVLAFHPGNVVVDLKSSQVLA